MKRIATGTARVVNGRVVEDSGLPLSRSAVMTGGAIACALAAAGLGYWMMQPAPRSSATTIATASNATVLNPTRSDVGSGSNASLPIPPAMERRGATELVPGNPTITGAAPRISSISPSELPATEAIASAVQDSMSARKQEAKSDQSFVAALRGELAKRMQPQESPKAMLDQLATDKNKMAQHNRDVMNRVQIDADPKRAATEVDGLRNNLQDIVKASVEKAKPGAADRSLVAALKPEVQARDNEDAHDRGPVRRHALGHRRARLWRSDEVHEDLRGQSARPHHPASSLHRHGAARTGLASLTNHEQEPAHAAARFRAGIVVR